jgi:hypothetical protein
VLTVPSTGDGTFEVIEANLFRQLAHISLKVRAGNDSSIKKYLAGKLQEFKVRAVDPLAPVRSLLLPLCLPSSEHDPCRAPASVAHPNRSVVSRTTARRTV